MHSSPEYDHIPWHLVSAAFQGSLTPEEQRGLEEWLALPGNQEMYQRLQRLWEQGMDWHELYRQANTDESWLALRQRMHAWQAGPSHEKTWGKTLSIWLRSRMARGMAAAVIITAIVFAADWWFTTHPSGATYENTLRAAMTVSLPDGTSVILQPGTKIRLDKGYNSTGRTVLLEKGMAFFGVSDRSNLAFEVSLDGLRIRDIGTRFSVRQTSDSILVAVLSGKVACIQAATGQSRQVGEGMSLSYALAGKRFGQPVLTGFVRDSSRNVLRFQEAALSSVVDVLEKMTGRTIRLDDPALSGLKLTARLDGETYEDAIRIICISLDLTYTEEGGTGVLKQRAGK
ncbi:FecR domain-containing protein [Flavitalea sp. BT771]|uniref:FecR family protein n=1 Tax=Flavitalea sp. BT771 TaxID=3063329 RepID=UPI0026E44C33|nr:FecR domain-containing protein [Flavitalea sp. BT771]MDO6432879.1 FecR domain-containing protein [Flavitalea sp. BT771]MDV6221845.1 FecR domain-containing protein [Flavitalea sp. BT771]